MSTSLLYQGFGVKNYRYLKTTFYDGRIIFHMEKKKGHLFCSRCGERERIIKKGRVERMIKTLPIGGKEVWLSLHLHRLFCHRCGTLALERLDICQPYKKWTNHLARYVVSLLKFSTIKDVANHLGMSWDTVKDIHRDDLFNRFKKKKRTKHLTHLGVDEIAIGNGQTNYLTLVVDMKSGEVVWVKEGRTSESLEPFMKRLHYAHARIKAVAMDMWPAYLNAVLKWFPPEVVVFDHFHIIANYNKMLDELRRKEAALAPIVDKRVYQGTRYLLLKGQEKIKDDKEAHERLVHLLELNQTLNTAYILKEELRELWLCPDLASAETYFNNWLKQAYASKILPVMKMASSLVAHKSGILNYFRHFISTGLVEGINNKIKTLKRMAYGFRDLVYFKLRIYFIHQARYELIG